MSQGILASRRFLPLFCVQAIGAFTDNVLKSTFVFLVAFQGLSLFGTTPAISLMIGTAAYVVPLLLFAWAVQRIPLSLMGVLQYIAPTLQFLVGVLVYREPFGAAQLVGFSLVWMALAVFTVEGVVAHRTEPIERAV